MGKDEQKQVERERERERRNHKGSSILFLACDQDMKENDELGSKQDLFLPLNRCRQEVLGQEEAEEVRLKARAIRRIWVGTSLRHYRSTCTCLR